MSIYIGATFWLIKVLDADCWGEGVNGQWLLYPTLYNSGDRCIWRGATIVVGNGDNIFPVTLDFTVPNQFDPGPEASVHMVLNPC